MRGKTTPRCVMIGDPFSGCVIAGTHSGVGKTTWSLALMDLAQRKGWTVQPFKVGPDYIDPAFHHEICAPRKSRNLDLFLLSESYVKECFARHCKNADIAIVEGVMGLFDGKAAKGPSGSTAEMAKLLRLPVFLVIDGSGMATSAAALVLGFRDFDPELKLAGVLVNRVNSESHFNWLKKAIEEKTGVPCLGYLPREDSIKIPERHLGLTTALEATDKIQKVEKAAAFLETRLDWNAFVAACRMDRLRTHSLLHSSEFDKKSSAIKVGVAYDAAFSFYYEDNFDLLRQAGAELVFFSPLADARLPADLDLIYLGGGFPEIHAFALSQNEPMRRAIRQFYVEGGTLYAECGGLIYLSEGFIDKERECPFVGLIPGKVRMTSALQHFGYKEFKTRVSTFLFPADKTLRSHEFHHSIWEQEGPPAAVYEMADGRQEGFAAERLLASYQHLHFGSDPSIVEDLMTHLSERRTVWSRK